MKLNNKGFAITAVLYGLLILFVILVSSYLVVLSVKKDRVENLTNDIEKNYRKDIQSLAEYITELYINADKTLVFNNNISYRYATSESLMNDRLGGTTEDYNAGNIRYYGSTPNNYIYFNCSDYENQSSSTCELWRIIGVFEDKVKIIRNTSIGTYAWNEDGSNNWSSASLQTYLNKDYYVGLNNDETKSIIEEIAWNIGGGSSVANSINTYYKEERASGNTCTGKIGLIYLSDYGYATDFNHCSTIPTSFSSTGCYDNDWLYYSDQWTLTYYSSNSNSTDVFKVFASSSIASVTSTSNVRPTLYLETNVSISDGDGSSSNPYQITL